MSKWVLNSGCWGVIGGGPSSYIRSSCYESSLHMRLEFVYIRPVCAPSYGSWSCPRAKSCWNRKLVLPILLPQIWKPNNDFIHLWAMGVTQIPNKYKRNWHEMSDNINSTRLYMKYKENPSPESLNREQNITKQMWTIPTNYTSNTNLKHFSSGAAVDNQPIDQSHRGR